MITDDNVGPGGLFPIAQQYPQFFNQNLVDQNRVIKVISGRDCWIRAFYYQLFKLMFEIQQQNGRIKQIQDILLVAVQNVMKGQKNQIQYQKVQQLINTISIFITHVNNNTDVQFQKCIEENHNIDQALIIVFQSIIYQSVYKDAAVYQKLKYLGKYFRQTMTYFQMGIKYQESDTFLFIQNQSEIYIAYLNASEYGDEDIEQNNNSQQQQKQYININNKAQQNQIKNQQNNIQLLPNQQHVFNNNYKNDEDNIVNQGYVTNSGGNQFNTVNQFNQGFKDIMDIGAGIRDYQQYGNTKQNIKYGQESKERKESIVYHYQDISGNGRTNKASEIQPKISNKQQLFYKPVEKINMQNFIKNVDSNSSSNGAKIDKKDPLDWVNQEEKGTFYKKFTDTKILNLVAEPYRTKVKMLKNRFVGVHSQKLFF